MTVESSIQIRREAEQKGQLHWHRLFERCWCGYLTVPAKYYDDKGRQANSQEDAEKAFLASLSPEQRTEIDRTVVRTESPTGDKRTGRPKKWASEAERLKAYRERSRG